MGAISVTVAGIGAVLSLLSLLIDRLLTRRSSDLQVPEQELAELQRQASRSLKSEIKVDRKMVLNLISEVESRRSSARQ